MGRLDVRWVVLLDNPRPEGEWKIIEALERRLPGGLVPRLYFSSDKLVRTLTLPSFTRWDEISSDAYPDYRHSVIVQELEEIQAIIGALPLYYGSDNGDHIPGDWLTGDETYELLECLQLVDETFTLVASLLDAEARALGKV